MEPALREATPLLAVMPPQVVTLPQVAAAEDLLRDGVLSMRTLMQAVHLAVHPVVHLAVTQFTRGAAAVVHRAAAPSMLAPFGVCSQRSMQPKHRYTIMVAVVVRPVVMRCSPADRPVVAAAGILPTATPVHG